MDKINKSSILNVSWIRILAKLIVPLIIIEGYIIFKSTRSVAKCDCFSNSYGAMTINIISLIFLVGSALIAYLMEKNKIKWRIIYTIATVILFIVAIFMAFKIGDYFYVPTDL